MDDFIPIINKAHGKAIIKETTVYVFYPIPSISPDISQPNL